MNKERHEYFENTNNELIQLYKMHCKKSQSKIRVKSNPSFSVGVALLITYTVFCTTSCTIVYELTIIIFWSNPIYIPDYKIV